MVRQIFFANNSTTYFGTGDRFIWRNNLDQQALDLDHNGNAFFTGNVNANGTLLTSDVRYKTNIIPLKSSLNNVLQLQGVNYNWKQKEFPEKMFNDKLQIGVIAQDIEKIYPELVVTNDKGFKSVNYAQLTPILIEAIKELHAIIENQKSEINTLKSDNTTLKSSNTDYENRLKKIEAYLQMSGKK